MRKNELLEIMEELEIRLKHLENDLEASMHLIRKGELTFAKWVSSIKEVRQSALFDEKDLLPFFVAWLKKIYYTFNFFSLLQKRT